MFAFTSYLKKHNYSNQIFRQTGYVHSYICCVDFIWFRVKIFHVCFLIFHDKPSLYLSNISCCQNKHCKFDWLTTSLFISFLAFNFLLIDHSIWLNKNATYYTYIYISEKYFCSICMLVENQNNSQLEECNYGFLHLIDAKCLFASTIWYWHGWYNLCEYG